MINTYLKFEACRERFSFELFLYIHSFVESKNDFNFVINVMPISSLAFCSHKCLAKIRKALDLKLNGKFKVLLDAYYLRGAYYTADEISLKILRIIRGGV